jgi:hypothetical protein
MAELTTFYCEEVFVFLNSCFMEDEGYFLALLRMFGQALTWVMALPEAQQGPFLERLDRVRAAGQKIGWGVGDEMTDLWWQARQDIPE